MKTALLACLVLSAVAGCPTPTAAQNKPVGTSDYSVPHYGGDRSIRLFADDPRAFYFTLSSSWIPGADRKGQFRYILSSWVAKPAPEDLTKPAPKGGWESSAALERFHNCNTTLVLYDNGGFVLRRISVIFSRTVDADSKVTSLDANDSAPMDLTEYRGFLKTDAKTSWQIAWFCD